MDLLRRHYAAGNTAGRRVLLEYTMLSGVNDSLEDAARLLELLQGVEAKVGGGGHGGPVVWVWVWVCLLCCRGILCCVAVGGSGGSHQM
jgi:hypothetical protein